MFRTGQLAAYIVQFNALRLLLWGYVKVHVYTDKLASIDALEDNIESLIHEIPAEMMERVWRNWLVSSLGRTSSKMM